MSWSRFWTSPGVFAGQRLSSETFAPTGLARPILVPERPALAEAAAMMELAARIGLEALALADPPFDALFRATPERARPHGQEAGDASSDPRRDEPGGAADVLLGADRHWLAAQLGEAGAPLFATLSSLPPDTGLLHRLPGGRWVITGSTPLGVLAAARHLATEGFGLGVADDDVVMVPYLPPARMAVQGPTVQPEGSLHTVLTTEGAFSATDGLHPVLDVSFPPSDRPAVVRAGVDLVARLALAAAEVVFPVTRMEGEPLRPSALVVRMESEWDEPTQNLPEDANRPPRTCTTSPDASRATGRWTVHLDGRVLVLRGREDVLPDLARAIGSGWTEEAHRPGVDDWRTRLAALTSPHPDISRRARLACALHRRLLRGDVGTVELPEPLGQPLALWRRQAGDPPGVAWRVQPVEPVRTFEWSDPGELAELRQVVFDMLADLAAPASRAMAGEEPLVLEVLTSVPETSFTAWWREVRAALDQRGLGRLPIRAVRRNSHKSALHWARTDVLPALAALRGVRRLRLSAPRFAPDVPHLDMPQRFLQELYPFDRIAAAALGLPVEDILIEYLDGEGPIWRVAAEDASGRVLGEWRWRGLCESLVYMPDRPALGHVLVPKSGVRAVRGDEILQERAVAPDALRFWRWFQRDVLPAVPRALPGRNTEPRFLRLTCDVWLDAEDEWLSVGEETSSVLEALHEDVYFHALHWFHEYGKRSGDSTWDAPGAILPFIHRAPGGAPPSATIRLYPYPAADCAWVTRTDGGRERVRAIEIASGDAPRAIRIEGAGGGSNPVRVTLAGVADPDARAALADWIGSAGGGVGGIPNEIRTDGRAAEAIDVETATTAPSAEPPQIPRIASSRQVPHAFGPVEVAGWVAAHRAGFPGRVRVGDHSFEGRPLWILEAFAPAGALTSPVKHRLYKPTLYINARHHANEVSSTHAALQLAESLAADPAVLGRINVVLVPLENADGAALHRRMAREHPRWKHHAARYNACGVEFAYDHFRPGTPFGESRLYRRIWTTWCPDVLVDDHGVPSHEWIQPFSGYNSPPRFPVSYWLPIARMYTIWYEIEDAGTAWTDAYARLRAAVTEAMARDASVASGNQEHLEAFRRWGHAFAPERFPLETSNGALTYVRRARGRPDSHLAVERFGEAVTAEIITEVDDETVDSEALAARQHAHHVVHRAILAWLTAQPVDVRMEVFPLAAGAARVRLTRRRPIAGGRVEEEGPR
ncbi:M14 family metallopeptidase [Alicyclobacillus sp.]|uniref:M14 family metallopeptidase n=1 Tax=Alicyclobacillus sp. TaxID=61169 RepID=UPI0025BFB31D|nr:M14 family metallopeptidase [Alicyclobacillus sp.]MCL6516672.1 hypothetical protein [Alicyclobacillus sp.]